MSYDCQWTMCGRKDCIRCYPYHTDYLEGTDFSKSRTEKVYGGESMHFNTYMHRAAETADYDDPFYPMASVVVEAAELCDLFVKPYLRGDKQEPTDEEILSEAGDVLWNLAMILKDRGLTLDEAAQYNLRKLESRAERGVIRGNGGNR